MSSLGAQHEVNWAPWFWACATSSAVLQVHAQDVEVGVVLGSSDDLDVEPHRLGRGAAGEGDRLAGLGVDGGAAPVSGSTGTVTAMGKRGDDVDALAVTDQAADGALGRDDQADRAQDRRVGRDRLVGVEDVDLADADRRGQHVRGDGLVLQDGDGRDLA